MGGGEHLQIGIQQDKAKLSRKKKKRKEIEQFKSETQKEMQVKAEK